MVYATNIRKNLIISPFIAYYACFFYKYSVLCPEFYGLVGYYNVIGWLVFATSHPLFCFFFWGRLIIEYGRVSAQAIRRATLHAWPKR